MMKTTMSFSDNDLRIPHVSWAILLVSALGLFLQMLFIRWVGTEIRIFAYLQNTILVVCFLGLGIGMFTSSKPIRMKQSLIPLSVFLTLMAIPGARAVMGSISTLLSSLGDMVIWGTAGATDASERLINIVAGLTLTYAILILIVDIFVPFGRILGRLMNVHSNPIWAYSINILGSILGTWLFVLFSFFYQPPFVWFLCAAILMGVFVYWSKHNRMLNLALLGLIFILSWISSQVPNALEVTWSPYQKLVVWDYPTEWPSDYLIDVNNTGYQAITNLSNEHISKYPGSFLPELKGLSQYDLPMLFHPHPRSVLIVGAGAGNDAAGALRHDVQSVTAVEIDPAIISIGRELHPEHPYSSPNVKVVNDDARSFFATTTDKYDLIVFGLLDSHTTTALTNARLDHYVYTQESITQAKSKLAPGGVMVLTFEAEKPFISDRIALALEGVFNQKPIVFRILPSYYGWGGVMFVTGDLNNIQSQLNQNPSLLTYIHDLQNRTPIQITQDTKITTDDWPYIYLLSPDIPSLYYLLIVLMILLFVRSNKKWQSHIRVSNLNHSFWHFFFLGAAFLLLEVQNISKASVVLGNTWQVNTVIISSILAMALLANWIAFKFPSMPLAPVYFLLVATCVALYFLDLARFGFLPYFTKALLVGSLTSLPMLFSGIVFIRSFADIKDKSNALGANLIGALVGALLQSITFVIGIKALLLVVAGLYLLSLITSPSLSVKVSQGAVREFAK